ncbi:MAG: hypothetical protein ACRD0G_11385 [Acidimicrobiales bacterium]
MSPPTTTATGFALVTPGDWIVLPLAPETRDRRIAKLVESHVGRADNIAHLRRQTIVQFRKAAAQAQERGAFFAALHSGSAQGIPMSASVLAFLVPAATGPDGELLGDVDEVAAAISEPGAGEVLERSTVDLAVGRAVRVRKLVRSGLRGTDGREPRSDSVQFFVPLPEADHLLVLTFATPILPLGDAYAELFDAMAATARWRPAGEEAT